MRYFPLSIAVLIFLFAACDNTPKEKKKAKSTQEIIQEEVDNRLAQKIGAIDVPESLFYCGEKVLTNLDDVKERLDRELLVNSYWHSNSIQLFKIANRYFPTIEKILKEEGVPEDLKYIALAESGLRNAVSPSGAHGTWQFLKGTAKDYGLEVSSTVDERYNLEKATVAAARYLKDAYEDLGSWTLATASYNIGRPRLKRIIAQQNESNYYDLYLNEETSRYLLRIVALKEIFSNSEKYGFNLIETDLYEPYSTKTIEIDTSISNLADFANAQGINYKTLKILNPWLRDTNLKNRSGKKYLLKLPN